MTEERRQTDPVLLDALHAIRGELSGLRDDFREDIREVRRDMQGSIDTVIVQHGKEHALERAYLTGLKEEAELDHARFDTYIRNAELVQARRDGALGVFRFTIELLGRYYRPLGALIIALTFAVAAVVGALTVEIGIQ